MEETKDYEALPVEQTEVQIVPLDELERANVDVQVSTAKRYPRDMRRSVNNSIVMATMNEEVARSCGYALPRGGKPVTGPSVHLAKIIVSNWGNMRTEAKVVQITDKQVISRGTAWDLENNVASAFEVRRSIVDKYGKRYSDDMITVTGNAANAIAYRNAVFAVIPKSITDRIYRAAQQFITGDLSDNDVLLKKRTKIFADFKNTYGIDENTVVKICGKNTDQQIGADEIALLVGLLQSLKDGDTTVDEVLDYVKSPKEKVDDKKAELKNKPGKAPTLL
nr:MAG TPA: hypothetical protein [Caudoviricetes sp.]